MLIYLQMLETPEEKSLFEQIYLEYCGLMFHVAYEILHNEQDAEDAVHQAFVKIAENIKKIDAPVCPKTHSYVVTIVEHQAIARHAIVTFSLCSVSPCYDNFTCNLLRWYNCQLSCFCFC